MDESLDVTLSDLPPVRVVMLEYDAEEAGGVYSESIGALFGKVEAYLKHRGFETRHLRRFGVPFSDGPMLRRYWCCIESPDGLVTQQGEVSVRELAGGRYAVLLLAKDSETIGPSIGRFYSEYVPDHSLMLDETRPPIELYHADTMEYCVPVR